MHHVTLLTLSLQKGSIDLSFDAKVIDIDSFDVSNKGNHNRLRLFPVRYIFLNV